MRFYVFINTFICIFSFYTCCRCFILPFHICFQMFVYVFIQACKRFCLRFHICLHKCVFYVLVYPCTCCFHILCCLSIRAFCIASLSFCFQMYMCATYSFYIHHSLFLTQQLQSIKPKKKVFYKLDSFIWEFVLNVLPCKHVY